MMAEEVAFKCSSRAHNDIFYQLYPVSSRICDLSHLFFSKIMTFIESCAAKGLDEQQEGKIWLFFAALNHETRVSTPSSFTEIKISELDNNVPSPTHTARLDAKSLFNDLSAQEKIVAIIRAIKEKIPYHALSMYSKALGFYKALESTRAR